MDHRRVLAVYSTYGPRHRSGHLLGHPLRLQKVYGRDAQRRNALRVRSARRYDAVAERFLLLQIREPRLHRLYLVDHRCVRLHLAHDSEGQLLFVGAVGLEREKLERTPDLVELFLQYQTGLEVQHEVVVKEQALVLRRERHGEAVVIRTLKV